MDPLEQHERAMEEFDHRVRLVGDDQWHLPTPCTEWDVRALVAHLVAEQLWAPHLLSGATLGEVGDRYEGDQLGTDPLLTWERSSRAAREAFLARRDLEGTVHTTMGELPTLEYARQMTLDLAIHAWDLARGIGVDDELDEELVEALYAIWEPRGELLTTSGVFASRVEVDEAADTQIRLLARLGRDAR